MKKLTTHDKFRKIAKFPTPEDKIICFIPSWEMAHADLAWEDEDKEYFAKEKDLFSTVRRLLLEEGNLSFFLYRVFEKNIFPERLPDPLGDSKKKIFKTRESRFYFEATQKINGLVRNITILPNTDEFKLIVKEADKAELHTVFILCVDYKKFSNSVLNHFLRMIERKKIIRSQSEPLYRTLFKASASVKLLSHVKLAEFISKAYGGNLSTADWDEIEYLSKNHLQNIKRPSFWDKVEKDGYLCYFNAQNLKLMPSKEKIDVRFFYSLESLLFFELREILKKIKRCAHCRAILPQNYTGRYCSSKTPSYSRCLKERNRERQRKFYKNLTKT